jgi:nucleoside recognition membrane protein YjiH
VKKGKVGVCEERLSALVVAVFQTGWQDFQDLQNGILIPLPMIFFYFVIFAYFFG